MVLMALDHTRMFVGPEVDLHTASPGALLHALGHPLLRARVRPARRHRPRICTDGGCASTRALSRYLLTRGLWLAFLEVTVIRVAWMLYIGPEILVLQVIWAIGVSMVVLAGLVWLPRAAIAAFAVALIAGHNLLDTVHAERARLAALALAAAARGRQARAVSPARAGSSSIRWSRGWR